MRFVCLLVGLYCAIKTIRYIRNEFSVHHYFSFCWLSCTNHFAKSVTVPDDNIVTHVYPNSLINRPPSGPISSDNRRCTVFGSNGSSLQTLHSQIRLCSRDRAS